MKKLFLEKIVIRFSGDSGDGIQLLGNQFTESSIITANNNIYTFIDIPPEIKTPPSSLSGISSFQLSISNQILFTTIDEIDILIAFNPSALKINLSKLKKNSIIIIDIDSFTDKNVKKSKFKKNPIETDVLKDYNLIKIPLTKLTYDCVKTIINSVSKAKRCKNFFILGVLCWIFDRNINDISISIKNKFIKNPQLYESNNIALKSGFNYAETLEFLLYKISITEKNLNINNSQKKISGNKAIILGILASLFIFNLPIFSANYPITPTSEIMHELMSYSNKNLFVIQMEDEISAICASMGAAFGGSLAITCTSGPGLDLMQESIGLAIMARLPIVILNIQRSGPSTGIPTKSEQTDLLASIFGRHGESSVPVIAPISPSDCFWVIIDAFCMAIYYSGPIIILSDTNIANSMELWTLPNLENIKNKININIEKIKNKKINKINLWIDKKIKDYTCIGGLEKDLNNKTSHDKIIHQNMTIKRKNYLHSLKKIYQPLIMHGLTVGDILLITWGSVYGLLKTIFYENIEKKYNLVTLLCLRNIYPIHSDLEKIINNFKKIIVIEENLGQLSLILKSFFLKKIITINQISGTPFSYKYLKKKIINIINDKNDN